MARRYFRFPISRVELTARKAYCNTMGGSAIAISWFPRKARISSSA